MIILNLRFTFKGAELSSPGTLTVMPAVSSILQSLMINFLFFPSDTIWILQVDFVSGEMRVSGNFPHELTLEGALVFRLVLQLLNTERDQAKEKLI